MNSLTVNRALLHALLTNASTTKSEMRRLCAHLSRVDAFLVGWWELCAYAPPNPEQFNFVVLCPTDAIAIALNNLITLNLPSLSRALPAVEIWIEGPGYGAVLPLLGIKMLNSKEENSRGNGMVAAIERRLEEQLETSPLVLEEASIPSSKTELVQLKVLAEVIHQTELKTEEIAAEKDVWVRRNPKTKDLFITTEDAQAIFFDRLEVVARQMSNMPKTAPKADKDSTTSRQDDGFDASDIKNHTPPMSASQENGKTENSSEALYKWRKKLTSASIKDTAQETYDVTIPKLDGQERDVFVKAIAGTQSLGDELLKMGTQILADIKTVSAKKLTGEQLENFVRDYKKCASNEAFKLQTGANL